MASQTRPQSKSDEFRLFAGAAIALVGIFAAVIVFKVVADKVGDAAQLTALASALLSLIGTVVGAFIGVQVGSQGQQNAEAARQDAHDVAMTLASRVPRQP